MTFVDKLKDIFYRKESQARIASSVQRLGKPVSTEANYEGFAKYGYSKNLVVYSAINKIATACSGVEWVLYNKKGNTKTEFETHPLLDLLAKPNPLQSTSEFVESVIGFKFITGNSYIEKNNVNGKVLELWPDRPDKMSIIPNARGYVQQYVFNYGGVKRYWDVDQVTLKSDIMHWKSFNPLNDWYGLSPLQAAMLSLDQNTAGQKWNLALLQNMASPSAVIQMNATNGNPRGTLNDEQHKQLKKEVDEWYSGPKNAGRPLVMEGGLEWKSIALSPKEMDFVKSKEVTAIDLLIAIGVPPEIMGLGQKTFNNYNEARLAFWEETNLPALDGLRNLFNSHLTPMFGDSLYLDYDDDKIEALQYRRDQKYISLAPVKFLTINEKRLATGYDEIDGGDELDSGGSSFGPTQDTTNQNNNNDSNNSNDNNDSNSSNDNTDNQDSIDNGKSWKSINLVNKNEKRRSWRLQNAKRKHLASSLNKELKEDFKELTKSLIKIADDLKGSDPKVVEMALIKESNDQLSNFEKTIRRHTKYTLEIFGQSIIKEGKSLGFDRETKANLKFDQFVESYIKNRTADQVTKIGNTNDRVVRNIIKEWTYETISSGDSLPELSKYLEAEFEDLTPGRARTIARTEVSLASNNGSREAAKALGIPGLTKEWVTAEDSRVRDGSNGYADHHAMDGVSVELDEKFTVPPDASMDGPGDPSASADQVINCRCVLTYKQKGK